MTREDFLLLAVTSGPSELADQLPVLASVFSVHEVSGDRVFVAEFSSPLKFPLPFDVDPTVCAPEYLDEDENGAFVWTYFAAVRPDLSTERAVAPRRKEMSAGLGIIADQAATVDFGLDPGSVIWAATVTIGQVEDPVAEGGGQPPVSRVDTIAEDEIDDPPTEPLQIPDPIVVASAPAIEPWADTALADSRRRRIALLIGIALAIVLLGLAVGLWLHDESGRSPSPQPEITTPATTSTSSVTSEVPPPPPPPPPTTTSETPTQTYVPYNPPRQSRPNITTPQTRPPDISVRPTHRPAFPNQPG